MSQIINYFTIAAVSDFLSKSCTGGFWLEAFSQQKDELVVALASNKSEVIYLRIGCLGNMQYVVPQLDYKRARKNSVGLFQTLVNLEILAINQIAGDRCILITLEKGFFVYILLHGNRSNVMLYQKSHFLEAFRSNIKLPESLPIDNPQSVPIPGTELRKTIRLLYEETDDFLKALRKAYPVFDQYCVYFIRDLMDEGMAPELAVEKTITLIMNDSYYIARDEEHLGFFLLPISGLVLESVSGIYPAVSQFLRIWYQERYFYEEKTKLQNHLAIELAKWQHRLDSANEGLGKILGMRDPTEIGHLLMAQLGSISTGLSEVWIDDFYKDTKLKVRLDATLTAVQNAEKYYRKGKEIIIKLQMLEVQSEEATKKLTELEETYRKIMMIEDYGDLKEYLRENPPIKGVSEEKNLPFKVFEFMQYVIWIGKSGKNNDLLTFRYASKDDLWLHAKDVAGAHVIVKFRPGSNFPKPVIEFAAGLAAYFSKYRNNTQVVVSYTLKKYIRKTKKLAPGQVLVEKEKTVLVTPVVPPNHFEFLN